MKLYLHEPKIKSLNQIAGVRKTNINTIFYDRWCVVRRWWFAHIIKVNNSARPTHKKNDLLIIWFGWLHHKVQYSDKENHRRKILLCVCVCVFVSNCQSNSADNLLLDVGISYTHIDGFKGNWAMEIQSALC